MPEDNFNEEIEEIFEDEEENDLTRDEFFEVLEHVSDVNEEDD